MGKTGRAKFENKKGKIKGQNGVEISKARRETRGEGKISKEHLWDVK